VTEEAGPNLDVPDPTLFGSARKIIVTKDNTIIQGGAGTQQAIQAHCEGLKSARRPLVPSFLRTARCRAPPCVVPSV